MKLKYKLPLASMLILIGAFIFLWFGVQKTALNVIIDYQHKISLANIEKGTRQIEQDIRNGRHFLRITAEGMDPDNLDWEDISDYLHLEIEDSVFDKIGLAYMDKTYNITGMAEKGDLSDRKYLEDAFKGKTVVSEPLLSKTSEEYQIVVAYPIIYNKEVKGLLIGTIPVKNIARHIYGLNIGGRGYGVLTSATGGLVIYSDYGEIPCEQVIEHIDVNTFTGKNGYIYFDDCDGKQIYTFYKKLDETGLMALMIVEESDLHMPVTNILNKNLKVFSLILILALFFTIYIIMKALKPIDSLIAAMKKLEDGDYTLQIPINKKDEIGEIAIQFNKTIEAISYRDEELQALNEELSSSFEELNETSDKLLNTYGEVAKRLQNERLINSLSETFHSKQDTRELLRAILVHTEEIINADRCAIYFYQDDGCFKVIESINFTDLDKCISFKKGEGTIGWIIDNKEELVITDITTDPRFKPKYTWSIDIDMLLQVPIFNEDEEVIGIISYIGKDLNLTFTPYLKQLSKTVSMTIQNTNLISEVKKTYFDIVRALVKSIELKDTYTRGHSERVMQYSMMLGEKLKLSSKELEVLKHGSILHDIGKLAIPDNILLKKGRLTNEEYDIIKGHSEKGMEFIQDLKFLEPTLSIIKHHHERIDGHGYPDGLKDDEIQVLTKIVTIADAYDAITSKRSYKEPLSKEDAIEELLEHKGTQFDTYLVEKFIEVILENQVDNIL